MWGYQIHEEGPDQEETVVEDYFTLGLLRNTEVFM